MVSLNTRYSSWEPSGTDLAVVEPADPTPPAAPYRPLTADLQVISELVGPDARIILELAGECDRLADLLTQSEQRKFKKPTETAAISTRRIQALKILAERLDLVLTRSTAGSEVTVIAGVLRLVKETMKEFGVSADARETIIQNLVRKIDEVRQKSRT